jgi:hypothetical protein
MINKKVPFGTFYFGARGARGLAGALGLASAGTFMATGFLSNCCFFGAGFLTAGFLAAGLVAGLLGLSA